MAEKSIPAGVEQDVSDTPQLDLDDLFHALSNERRRRALQYLIERDDDQFEMGDVAEVVASQEYDIPRKNLSSDQRQRIYIALYQCHLPQLAKVGLIDYDQKRGTIEKRPELEQTMKYLPGAPSEGDGDTDLSNDGTGESEAETFADLDPRTAAIATFVTVIMGLSVLAGVLAADLALLLAVAASFLLTGLLLIHRE